MRTVYKLAVMPALLFAALFFAGCYGALHNQISYTVAPSYFHDFKFHQFQIPSDMQDRLGAAVVGWRASWWMGFLIGVPSLLVGFLATPSYYVFLRRTLQAYAVVTVTALVVGLASLSVAFVTMSDPFERAGMMHNFSYLGGFFGIVTGCGFLISKALSDRKLARSASEGRASIAGSRGH